MIFIYLFLFNESTFKSLHHKKQKKKGQSLKRYVGPNCVSQNLRIVIKLEKEKKFVCFKIQYSFHLHKVGDKSV